MNKLGTCSIAQCKRLDVDHAEGFIAAPELIPAGSTVAAQR